MESLLLGAPPMAFLSLSLSPRLSSSTSQTLSQSLSSSSYSSLSLSPLSPPSHTHTHSSHSNWIFKKADGAFNTVVYCGRGDKKNAKGKRFNHSFINPGIELVLVQNSHCNIVPLMADQTREKFFLGYLFTKSADPEPLGADPQQSISVNIWAKQFTSQ
ncbi:hypothetical protein RJ640_023425 [Escallonia rubra]|uniref:Uncharacterized protein n=1 Tax=Escallonia rubra TaxID=112253 RepID=A0AA88QTU8_9ASTE|nr:hypothetical protein RJ640_023425 [Escallonia rubra]